MTPAEVAANALNATSIVLAARNSVHTWWVGMLGCSLFGYVFFDARLYADVTLQVFFVFTSALGWWNWVHGGGGDVRPVRRTRPGWLLVCVAAAVVSALGYGLLLERWTQAVSPMWDSVVLTFSVLGQYLLMGRRIENWPAWLVVNTVAVPLYLSRELYLTAALYAVFWINACWGWVRWRRELVHDEPV